MFTYVSNVIFTVQFLLASSAQMREGDGSGSGMTEEEEQGLVAAAEECYSNQGGGSIKQFICIAKVGCSALESEDDRETCMRNADTAERVLGRFRGLIARLQANAANAAAGNGSGSDSRADI